MAMNINTLIKELAVKFPGKHISIVKEHKRFQASKKTIIEFSLYIEEVTLKSNIKTYDQLLEIVIFYLKEE